MCGRNRESGLRNGSKEIEDLLHIMNEAKVEFTIPDESHKGQGKSGDMEIE